MKKILAALCMLFLLSGTVNANHGTGPQWRPTKHGPTVIDVYSVTPWPEEIDRNLAEWAASGVLKFNVTHGTVCSPLNTGRLTICSQDTGSGTAGGFATVKGKWVTSFNIAFELGSSAWTIEPTRRYLICHEIGHAFGLGHDYNLSSDPYHLGCMNTGNQSGLSPSPHDIDELLRMYG